jgi:hypothetical protein
MGWLMKNSKKLFSSFIVLCISTSIFANSTGSKYKLIAFDDGWQNSRSNFTFANLPLKNSIAKHEDQHVFKVADNPNFDHLNFSYHKKEQNNSILCLNTISPCSNSNQSINITDDHINNGHHFYAKKHDSDQSFVDDYSFNGMPGCIYYNHNLNHHGSNNQNNNNNNNNGNGNGNGNGTDKNNGNGGYINPSQLPVVPAPQAVFLTSTGLWVLNWLRRKNF